MWERNCFMIGCRLWDIISNVDQSVAWETNVCQRGRHALNPVRIDTAVTKKWEIRQFSSFSPSPPFPPRPLAPSWTRRAWAIPSSWSSRPYSRSRRSLSRRRRLSPPSRPPGCRRCRPCRRCRSSPRCRSLLLLLIRQWYTVGHALFLTIHDVELRNVCLELLRQVQQFSLHYGLRCLSVL